MKLSKLEEPKPGLLVFNGNLMARIKRLNKEGFSFYVENGDWNGKYNLETKMLTIVESNRAHFSNEEFQHVDSLTWDEMGRWYVRSLPETTRREV